MDNSFIEWLLRNKFDNKIFILGFVFAVLGYSGWAVMGRWLEWSEIDSYKIFFICISLSFFFYTLAYFLTKYKEWRWFPMFVTLVCLSRVSQEVFYPEMATEYDWWEYFNFVLNIFIVVFYYIRYRFKEFIKQYRFNR